MESSAESSAQTIDAATLLRLFDGAVAFLAVRASRLNTLNVFPVPDGDTGTNLLLTLRAAVQAAREAAASDLDGCASALARGALLGARGNSGVILSQYLHGFAEGLAGAPAADGAALARAFTSADRTARAAIAEPAEGTILTVAGDVAVAARESAAAGNGPAEILNHAVLVANQTVDRTREMLPALRQANVVDSGALGLSTILDGLSRTLQGEAIPASDDAAAAPMVAPLSLESYTFCTEFLIRGTDLDLSAIRREMAPLGNSLLVVGDPALIRVHVHTDQPDRAIERARGHGQVDQTKVENMREQNRRLHHDGHSAEPALPCTVLIAVADGAGFRRLFQSLGASGVVSRGPAILASLADLLGSVRTDPAGGYVILPNDHDLVALTEKAAPPGAQPILVVPTHDAAQGVMAALAFQADRPPQENFRAMSRALAGSRTGKISRTAESPSALITESPDPIVGTINGCVVATGSEPSEVALRLLTQLKGAESEILTLYRGAAIPPEDSAALRARVQEAYPHLQVDLLDGGQASNLYILACE